MNKIIYRVSVAICFGMALVACKSSLEPVISDSACEPPCWNRITPGKSTPQQVMNLLDQTNSIEENSIHSIGSWNIFKEVIRYSFTNDAKGEVDVINDTVSTIAFFGDIGFTYQEAIDMYGEPETVISERIIGPSRFLIGDADFLFVEALIPSRGIGFGFSTRDLTISSIDDIQSKTNLDWLIYFDPNAFDQLKESGVLYAGSSIEDIQIIKP